MKRSPRTASALACLCVICTAAAIHCSVAPSARVEADVYLSSAAQPYRALWRECVGSGHAKLALRADYADQLKKTVGDLGFRRVRFHGIFDKDVTTVVLEEGVVRANFSLALRSLQTVVEAGAEPLVELSFMPPALARGKTTVFFYQANVNPPMREYMWEDLIHDFALQVVREFGWDLVRNWMFEIWNEPNLAYDGLAGFLDGDSADYLALVRSTVRGMSRAASDLGLCSEPLQCSCAFRMGGPVTSAGGWLDWFVNHTQLCPGTVSSHVPDAAWGAGDQIPMSFMSTHAYPTDQGKLTQDTVQSWIGALHNAATAAANQSLPFFLSEFNSGLYTPVPEENHDNTFAAAFLAAAMPTLELESPHWPATLTGVSYWTFSDIFEEVLPATRAFYNGYGLQTKDGIPKAAYRAMEFLARAQNSSVARLPLHMRSANAACNVDRAYAFAFHGSATTHVLLTAFAPPLNGVCEFDIRIRLPPGSAFRQAAKGSGIRCGGAGDAHAAWVQLGRPSTLTPEARSELLRVSVPESFAVPRNGDFLGPISVAPFDVVLVDIPNA